MRKTEKCSLWVVYRMRIHGKLAGANAVCEQGEWDAMERAQPGHQQLVQTGITSECEAERLARSAPLVAPTHADADAGLAAALVADKRKAARHGRIENTFASRAATLVGVAVAADPLPAPAESALAGPH